MLRYKTVLALVAVLGLGMMTADTFGQCSKSKATQVAAKKAGCCQSAFPTMKTLVGDKDYGCHVSAEKAAKASDAKIVYVVAGEKYGCRISATKALADAAEDYVKKYTTIACVVDGKVMYCDDKSSCSSEAKGKTVSAGATCSKSRTATLVKEDGRSDDAKASTCSKSRTAKLAKAAGCCSSKSKTAKLVKEDARSDDSKASTCSKSRTAKLAKAEAASGCSKSRTAKLAKAEAASGCSKSRVLGICCIITKNFQ